jgi:hypothetical protein
MRETAGRVRDSIVKARANKLFDLFMVLQGIMRADSIKKGRSRLNRTRIKFR